MPTARQNLEREISTLLQALDSLETDAEAPGRAETLAPELARVDAALTSTVQSLRALAPAGPPRRPALHEGGGRPASRPPRRRQANKPAFGRERSTNAYLPDLLREPLHDR